MVWVATDPVSVRRRFWLPPVALPPRRLARFGDGKGEGASVSMVAGTSVERAVAALWLCCDGAVTVLWLCCDGAAVTVPASVAGLASGVRVCTVYSGVAKPTCPDKFSGSGEPGADAAPAAAVEEYCGCADARLAEAVVLVRSRGEAGTVLGRRRGKELIHICI